VFLKAWEKLEGYELRGLPFGAWLFRIARNTLIDYYRVHRETIPLEASEVELVAANQSVAGEVEKKIEADSLWAQLSQLTEDQRQVLTLKFIDGLTTEEIAQMLGKREGAIRALQMRGLQTLATLLKPDSESLP
jgi:RNA polymerase sigma-70 factor, ECF subfamily